VTPEETIASLKQSLTEVHADATQWRNRALAQENCEHFVVLPHEEGDWMVCNHMKDTGLIEILRSLQARAEAAKQPELSMEMNEPVQLERRAAVTAVLYEVGGTVEGQPTSSINYLQRLRALVETEQKFLTVQTELIELRRVMGNLLHPKPSGRAELWDEAQAIFGALSAAAPLQHVLKEVYGTLRYILASGKISNMELVTESLDSLKPYLAPNE